MPLVAARVGLIALLFLPSAAVLAADAAPPVDPAGVAFFESKVRPLLVQYCYECHSADAKKSKGGLVVDTRQGLLQGGDSGPAIVPGKPDDSRLIKAVRFADPDLQMPPKKRLPAEAVDVLEKWVAMGAPDPRDGSAPPAAAKKEIDIAAGKRWWSFRPLAVVDPPKVDDAAWSRSPIDRFVRAKQAAKGVVPNGPADKGKLVRRAYFDLTGLPPTPAEVNAFVADDSPDAYATLIDRLLDSDRFGERWGRHWLDVARFAESGGYEFDKDRAGAYHYRDFVIRALNADMPYDRFVRLQLAGDKLQPGDYDAGAATGFVVAGPYPGQTTAKTLEPIRYDHLDDMVSTVGTAMLGLTVGCARCHDHKYDPFPDEDYYRLAACFARTDSTDLQLNPDVGAYRKAKEKYDAAHAPLAEAWERFRKDDLPARFEAWRASRSTEPAKTPWLVLDWESATGTPALKNMGDGSYLATGSIQRGDVYTFVAKTNQSGITSVRLDALSDPTLPLTGPGRADPGNFKLTRIELKASPLVGQYKGKSTAVALRPIAATSEANNQPLSHLSLSDAERKEKKLKGAGWAPKVSPGAMQSALFETAEPVGFDGGTQLTLTLKFEESFAIGRPRVAIATADGHKPTLDGDVALQNVSEIEALLDKSGGAATDANRDELHRWFRAVDPQAAKAYMAMVDHAFTEPRQGLTRVFAAGDKGNDVYFLSRGDPGKKGDKATPGFIQVLMADEAKDARWTTPPKAVATTRPTTGPATKPTTMPTVEPRVALADWITDVDDGAGHLLARVIVNRLWQHHMGRGIVGTPNDFGTQGDAPTHPELLDWLANELVRNGWHLKPIHRLIMTSNAYTLDNATNPANAAIDPENKLLWRRPVQRLEAEAVRDALLAVSGTLDPTPFGPGTADGNGPRRSVYLTVKRSKPIPFLQIFDAPEAMQSIGRRESTTVATQALAMLNSPFVRDRAEKLAARVKPAGKDRSDAAVSAAINEAYRLALGRPATDAEREQMVSFVRRQGETYGKDEKAVDRGLADFCQALLCSSEFVYVE